ncbi:type I pullulanase [Neobacillus sp. D3-1R]|uniref:type I pullulanase n=1 Tax=Neobacillus sp. D3-1R TaxID=3445778 RepID=UPI003FA10504
MISIKRNFFAYLDDLNVITILLPFSYHEGNSNLFYILDGDQKYSLQIKEKHTLTEFNKYICDFDTTLEFGRTYWIVDEFDTKTDLQVGAVIRTNEFDSLFYYDGNDLGVFYNEHSTKFTLWAPTATQVNIKIISPEGSSEVVSMCREEKGIWTYKKQGNLEGFTYTYLVCVNLRWREAVDPYATAVTANGKEGVIINLEKTRLPKPILPPFTHPVDAIIYETHIRDLTIHPQSGIHQKGKYIGAAETNTSSLEGGLTGLSYMKELGITHVEFLPVQDFEGVDELGNFSEYNWGYNPIHFNVPEGSYSTNPRDPYSRILELKQLVRTVQENGIRVILDVVYNHVYDRENSTFEKIVPGYFFRHDEFGMPSNGTGVGNDIASERLMVRKFIIDSVRFWVQEYGIDGLRFDLMGILDIETMEQVREVVEQLDPSFLMIGEGWDLNTPLPTQEKAILKNQFKLPKIAQFNDVFRDSIKGSTFNLQDKGFVFGNHDKITQTKMVISGSIGLTESESGIFQEPSQTVNYLESHDNHTMWDKFLMIQPEEKEEDLRKYHLLASTILLLSQGVPFLHSGQEFFRTKEKIGNSYNSPNKINWLDWKRKQTYLKDIEYLKGIIELRKSNQAFRLRSASQIRTHFEWLPLSEPILGYRLKDIHSYGEWSEIVVIFNPLKSTQTIPLPIKGEWFLLANHQFAGATKKNILHSNTVLIEPISAIVIGHIK